MFKTLIQKSNFQQAVKIIFLFDIFVRGIQFLRELVFSTFYGFSKITDAFNFTVNILGTPINLIADALLVGIIPSLNTKSTMQEKTNYVFSLMITFFCIITIIFLGFFSFYFSIMEKIAPGFDSGSISLTLKFCLLYAFIGLFLVLNRIIDNFFRSEKIFGLANFSNLVSSIISILILVLLFKQTPLAITIGMLIGSVVGFVILFSKLPIKRMTSFDKDAIALIKKSVPLLISGGLGVINTFIDKSFSTLFEPGILTIISYSTMIVTLISSLFTNAIGGASYSFIASEVRNNQLEQVQSRVNNINFIFMFVFGSICILFILVGEFFLKLLFYRGNITLTDIDLLFQLTLIFIPMTMFTSIGSIVLQTFYSFDNLKVTTIINSLCVLLHIAINIIFIDHFGFYTLASSTLIASMTAAILNAYLLKRNYGINSMNYKILLTAALITLFCLSALFLQNIWLQLLITVFLTLIFILLFKTEVKGIKGFILANVLRKKA
ncbi:lipid II flippase MurJ [Bacillaceae bacterium CLA-AA-H227]|uniref:Lipid II flippase MurJ n=1 Tax=Robertmurraya yapensis (ex Hitch et al 2024) TaxID=3133160 RepID=A0ACC6SBX6_9BACI